MIRQLILWPLLALLAFSGAAAVANALGGPPRPVEAVQRPAQPEPINLYGRALHHCLPDGTTAAGEWCA